MNNYFRITAYHPQKDICAVFDSNGRFEKLWQFSSFLVQKGFKIIEVGSDDKFCEGNIPKVPEDTSLILLRHRFLWQFRPNSRYLLLIRHRPIHSRIFFKKVL